MSKQRFNIRFWTFLSSTKKAGMGKRFRSFLEAALVFSGLLFAEATQAQNALVFNINLTGTVNTNRVPFTSTGALLVTTTIDRYGVRNGVNPIDLALVSGSPASYSRAGAINYFTNFKLLKPFGGNWVTSTTLDFAYVTKRGNCVNASPDKTLLTGLHKRNPNIFNVKSGVSAQIYNALKGTVKVCSNDGWKTVTGSIDLLGTSYFASANPTMPYKAKISGNYVGLISF